MPIPAVRVGRAVQAAAVAAALTGGLTGCAAVGSTTSTTEAGETCADWVTFETPRDAAAAAGVVLRGTVAGQDDTAPMHGVDANRWLFDVEQVLERPEPDGDAEPPPEVEVEPGERVAVVSTPETCTAGGPYPGGDPLDPATGLGDETGSVIVLLSDGGGVLHLITPFQGVLTPAADGSLPAEWPAP
jgi:hypothetical protein